MWWKLYAIALLVLSIITFFVYLADKKKAKKGAWRISEKTLLTLSFFGGAVGGFASMYTARHKTKHWYFFAVNLLGLVWQAALFVFLLINGL